MTTYYDILGVGPRASAYEIKAAHRRWAMKFHPDMTLGADTAVRRSLEDRFRDIQEAYDTLKDKAKRAEYDAMLAMLNSGEYYEPPPPPPPPPRKAQYCPWCRKAVPASAPFPHNFCVFCGASLQSSTPFSNRERPQPPPPPQTQPKQNPRTRGQLVLLFYAWMIAFGIICAPIHFLLQGVFNISDDAANQSACFLVGSLVVTWIFFVKKKVKRPVPLLIHPIILFLIGTAIAVVDRKEASQLPGGATPARAVQRLTSKVAASRQSPKPASQPRMNVPLARPTASQGVTHAPMVRTRHFDLAHPSVGGSQISKLSAEPTISGLPAGFFAIGSPKAEVRQIQGTPTSVTDAKGAYGPSSDYFSNEQVVGGQIDSSAQLGVKELPTGQVDGSQGFFTVGSTKDEVLAVQGTPTSLTDTRWRYGLSSVYFTNGRVVSWWIYPSAPLKVKMLPTGHVDGNLDYFTVGSTKDEVLVVQGTPTSLTDTEWDYGTCNIYFSRGRVIGWLNDFGAPLRVKMLPTGHVDGNLDYFTVGSTKDEVLAVQGTPTSLTDARWGYGLSRVYFWKGRVVSWGICSSNPLKVRGSEAEALGLKPNIDSAHVQFGVALGNQDTESRNPESGTGTIFPIFCGHPSGF